MGFRTRRGRAAIPALGSDPEQECWSPTGITFCSATGTLGIVTALQGCASCPFLAILALGTTGFWHHRYHCNRSQHPGEMELMSLCTVGWEQSHARCPGGEIPSRSHRRSFRKHQIPPCAPALLPGQAVLSRTLVLMLLMSSRVFGWDVWELFPAPSPGRSKRSHRCPQHPGLHPLGGVLRTGSSQSLPFFHKEKSPLSRIPASSPGRAIPSPSKPKRSRALRAFPIPPSLPARAAGAVPGVSPLRVGFAPGCAGRRLPTPPQGLSVRCPSRDSSGLRELPAGGRDHLVARNIAAIPLLPSSVHLGNISLNTHLTARPREIDASGALRARCQ